MKRKKDNRAGITLMKL